MTGLVVATLPLVNAPAYAAVLVVVLGWWATGKVLPAASMSAKDAMARSLG